MDDYISITDIARFKDARRTDYIIQNWLRNRNTLEFLGIWERLNNPNFNPIEFERFRNQAGLSLKDEEQKQFGWDIRRNLTKINYRIHTDAIRENLLPGSLTKAQINQIYASEADVLNMALFGKTAAQWRGENPDERGNIRDFANVSQLVCLANLENLNAVFIQDGLPQSERLRRLNAIAIQQMKILLEVKAAQRLEGSSDDQKEGEST